MEVVRAAPATLAIAAVALVIHAASVLVPGTFEALVHSDGGLVAGEMWRAASAHLVHLDAGHLVPNLIGLLALGWPLERRIGSQAIPALLGTAGMAIALGVLLDPATARYCGLSGTLNALFVVLCVEEAREPRAGGASRALWFALLAGGLSKIGWEWSHAPLLPGTHEWPPHALSHLVGYVTGVAAAAWLACAPRLPGPVPRNRARSRAAAGSAGRRRLAPRSRSAPRRLRGSAHSRPAC